MLFQNQKIPCAFIIESRGGLFRDAISPVGFKVEKIIFVFPPRLKITDLKLRCQPRKINATFQSSLPYILQNVLYLSLMHIILL